MLQKILSRLSRDDFETLYNEYGTLHTMLQLLPKECYQIFNLLFCVRRPLSKERIASNFRNVSKEEMDEFFRKLLAVHICEPCASDPDSIELNPVFLKNYEKSLNSGNHCQWSFRKELKHEVSDAVFYCEDCYHNNNSLLLDPVSYAFPPPRSPHAQPPSMPEVRDCFLRCKLLRADSAAKFAITATGYQFLMKSYRDQAWWLLHPHITASNALPSLSFLFSLRHMIPCRAYDVAALTDPQRQLLEIARIAGVVYTSTTAGKRVFFATPLGAALFSQEGASRGEGGRKSGGEGFMKAEGSMRVVIEANFHVYAFGLLAENRLHIQLLRQFLEPRTILPNMASFLMTRQSVMNALRNGITADQICSFLESYSENATRLKEVETKLDRNRGNAGVGTVEDANMKGKDGYYAVPLNVMDQLYLWEREMNRASYQRAFLYRDLDMNTFGRIDDSKEIKPFVLFKDNQTKMIVVSAEGKERIQRMRF